MKTDKILAFIFLLTFVAIIYVNQQALIYQMGLQIKENQDMYSKIVDHNKILVYNVLNLRSPVKLETRLLAKEVRLDMPRKWQVFKLKNPAAKKLVSIDKNIANKNILANPFVIAREVKARPDSY